MIFRQLLAVFPAMYIYVRSCIGSELVLLDAPVLQQNLFSVFLAGLQHTSAYASELI
jgi:hypothetical protein